MSAESHFPFVLARAPKLVLATPSALERILDCGLF
jgi:hypothetical protein